MGNFSKSERRRLDSIGTLWFKGQPFKKTDIVESGKYPCLHYGELFSKYGAIIDSVSSRCDVLPKRLSQKGDILFPASDVTPAGLTRCSAIMQENVILGGDVIGFRPQTGLNPIYLSYAIRHQKGQLLQRVTGALIKHISTKSLQSVIIPIHPIESQNRFEKQVRHLNRIISHRRTQLAKLDELVKCRFVEMFGDTKNNPYGWVSETVDSVTEEIIGGVSVSGESRKIQKGELAVLKVSAVTYGVFKCDEYKVISNDIKLGKYVSPKKGDLLFSRANTKELVGATALVDKDYPHLLLPDKIWKIIVRDKVSPVYMKAYLSEPWIRELMSKVATGTSGSMYNISMEKLRQIPVILPPIERQNAFAAFVSRIDKLRFISGRKRVLRPSCTNELALLPQIWYKGCDIRHYPICNRRTPPVELCHCDD